jgi:hypothetical protein
MKKWGLLEFSHMLSNRLLIIGGIFIPPGHMGRVCLPGLVDKVGPAHIDSVFGPVDYTMG